MSELLNGLYISLTHPSLLNYHVWQMSLVPLLFRDWWDDLDRPSRLLDQHFGLGLRHNDLLHPGSLLRTGYIRPWRNITRQDSGSSSITADKDKFQVNGQC
jgi:Alpha crystallin A chain, N terminal.